MRIRKRPYQRMLKLIFMMGIFLSAYPLLAASNVKLSGTMPSFGDVNYFRISPSGQYAVYLADQDTDGVLELYSVPLGGGSPIRLNPLLPTGRGVSWYQISPDSSRVVYRAALETDNVFDLYSVPIGGPVASGIKLNGALVTGGNVDSFQISPDSSRVVYMADQETNNVYELYSVPVSGPAASGIKLNGTLVAGVSVGDFQITLDSSRVVYRAGKLTNNVLELYSVLISGPAASGIKLNGALVTGGNVDSFQISPDSSRVVYVADQQTDNVLELYSVPINGPAASGIKLNVALVAGGGVDNWFILISPDSSRVVYVADQETDNVYELYSVPIAGPAASGIKLNGALVAGGNVSSYFQITPDNSQVIYIADQDTNEVSELYMTMTSNYLLHLPLIMRQF